MRSVEVLISEGEIQKKVGDLARSISGEYTDQPPLLLGILKGCIYFLSDLSRKMSCDCSIDFMAVESYDGESSTGAVKILMDLASNVEGRDVLIVEDIVDTGMTLSYVIDLLMSRKPRSLKVVALLFKPGSFKGAYRPDFVGFEIPNEFVVGYGMDLREKYRNLAYIGKFGN